MKSYYCNTCKVSFFVKSIKVDGRSGYMPWSCDCPRCGKPAKEKV